MHSSLINTHACIHRSCFKGLKVDVLILGVGSCHRAVFGRMLFLESTFLDADSLGRQGSCNTPRAQSKPFHCLAQQPPRRSSSFDSRRSLDSRRCAHTLAHRANIVQAAAVALASQQMEDITSSSFGLSWAEQRRLLEESYQAEAAPENVSSSRAQFLL